MKKKILIYLTITLILLSSIMGNNCYAKLKPENLYDEMTPKLEVNDFYGAIEVVNKYIKEFPNKPNLYNNRGLVYKNLRMFKEAEDDFRYAIKLDPNYPTPYYSIACMRLTEERYEDTLFELNKLFAVAPNFPPGIYIRMLAEMALGKYDDAIKDAELLIELKPREYPESDIRKYLEIINQYKIKKTK